MGDDEVRGVRFQQPQDERSVTLQIVAREVRMRVVAIEERIFVDRRGTGRFFRVANGLSQMSNENQFQAGGDVFDSHRSNEGVGPGAQGDQIENDNHRVPEEEEGEQLLEEKVIREDAFHGVPMGIVQMVRFPDSTSRDECPTHCQGGERERMTHSKSHRVTLGKYFDSPPSCR